MKARETCVALVTLALVIACALPGVAAAAAGAATGASPAAPVPIPVPSPEAIRYYHSGNVLWIVATVWGFLVPAVMYFSGFSAWLRTRATRISSHWYLSLLLYFLFFWVSLFVANVALDYFSDFVRPHAYGLSSQTTGKWLHDELLNAGLGLIAGALFLWIPYLLLRRAPRRWWLYTWVAGIPILLVVSFVEPIWLEPLFNEFGPMQDKALEARILDVAHRAGIEGANVYQVNKSVDTNELNAYVTGIGNTKRIVLWDTIIKQATPDQLVMVMSHEMGHYVLGHVWTGLILGIFVLLLGLWLVHRFAAFVLHRFAARTGVSELGDVASLPLLMLLFGLFIFLLSPVLLAFSRHQEHEADRFGLEITHDNHACATAFVTFVEHDLAYPNPGPLYVLWRSSHPTLAQRIAFCNDYHPWLEGRAGRYGEYFKAPAAH